MTHNTEAPQSRVTPNIRAAAPSDRDALERIAALDGREIGEAPLLVAECGGAVVAALSITDGSVVADPFHYTLEAVAMLKARVGSQGGAGASRGAAVARALTRPAVFVAVVCSAILVAAAGADAAPKPGLPAGTWVGTGSAVGTDTESGISSRFTARLRFRIVVAPGGRVSGTGSFSSDMVVKGEYPAIISSQAAVTFGGTPTSLVYTGVAHTRGTFDTVTRTLKPIALKQRLPISRAGACKASGGFVFNGVVFHWSAARKIDGTCRA